MSKPFIRLYNVFTEDGVHKLTSRQLYFYSLLAAMKSVFMNATHTTLSLIDHSQLILTDNKESRRIQLCKSIIQSLKDTGVITLESDTDLKANTPLTISFPVLTGGYEDIHIDMWEKVSSADELMVFTLLKRMPGFEKSKDQWSRMLGYSSKNTGHEILTRMESDGKIYSVEGKIYTDAQGRIKQLPTKWYIGKRPEPKQVEEQSVIPQTIEIDDNSGIKWGNWKGSGNLTLDDYIMYVEQEYDPEFLLVADAKLKRVTKNGTNDKAVYAIAQAIAKAREELLHREQKEKKAEREKKKEYLIETYGICIELEDGSIVSHKDKFDWSEMKKFFYSNPGSGVAESTVGGKYPIYEAVLPQYDYISFDTLMNQIKPYIVGDKKIEGVEEIETERREYEDMYRY